MNPLLLAALLPLNFTAPACDSLGAPCDHYVLRQTDEWGVTSTRVLYADSSVTAGAPVPKAPGSRERIFYNCSEDGKARMYRLIAVNAAGREGDLSNAVVNLAGALPDTFYVDLTGDRARIFTWSRPAPVEPAKFYASWMRAPGDSSFTILPHWQASLGTFAPVLSGRDFQFKDRPAACATSALFGAPSWCAEDHEHPCP